MNKKTRLDHIYVLPNLVSYLVSKFHGIVYAIALQIVLQKYDKCKRQALVSFANTIVFEGFS